MAIAFMNLEFMLLRRLSNLATQDEGVMLKGVHGHPLHFTSEVRLMMCGLCRERIGPKTGGYQAFRCNECSPEAGHGGFSVCMLCYRKHLTKAGSGEGLLRGDKGPKVAPE